LELHTPVMATGLARTAAEDGAAACGPVSLRPLTACRVPSTGEGSHCWRPTR
jgi:hypothetical protein